MEKENNRKVKNFLYTKSYVKKRLLESGFDVKVLPARYSPDDDRYWSVIVSRKGGFDNLILTCMRSGIAEKYGDFYVMGPKFMNFRIQTKSMEVLEEQLRMLVEGNDDRDKS